MTDNQVSIEMLSQMRGVSKQSGYKAKESGHIEVDPETGMCPLDSEKNQKWIHRKPKSGAKKGGKVAKGQTGGNEPTETDDRDLLEMKEIAERIRYKQKQNRDLDLKFAKSKEELITYDTAKAWIGSYGSGVRTHILEIPKRIATRVHSAVQSGQTVEDVQAILEDEVTAALEKALEIGERATAKVVEEYEEEEEDERD